jgi:molybdopterin molybdotransferase
VRLNAQRLGLLAGCGIAAVRAYQAPRVSVLATGSELVLPGQPLSAGQIYDSNRIVLRQLLAPTGALLQDHGVVPDDPQAITERLREGLAADVLLISGGVSVGSHDYVKAALEACGVATVFWRVNMKPGKPLFCGRGPQGWVFGLPGNPISCVVGLLVFVEPLLRRLQGEVSAQPPYHKARLTHPVRKQDTRRWFLTGSLSCDEIGQMHVTPTAHQGSAMTQALAEANALLVIPEAQEQVAAGQLVDVLPLPA